MLDVPQSLVYLQWLHILKVWMTTHKFLRDANTKPTFLGGLVITFLLNEIGGMTVNFLTGSKCNVFRDDWVVHVNLIVYAIAWIECTILPVHILHWIFTTFNVPLAIVNEARRSLALMITLHGQYQQHEQLYGKAIILGVVSTTTGSFLYPIAERLFKQPPTTSFITAEYATKVLTVPILASISYYVSLTIWHDTFWNMGAFVLVLLFVGNKIINLYPVVVPKSKA